MNPLLIIRAEIICFCILVFILLSSRYYKMGKDRPYFIRICLFAIGHVVFDIITVVTVNNIDTIPYAVNKLFHIIFYLFALLFSFEFFCYVISICYRERKQMLRRIRLLGLIPMILYIAAVPFLPMEYIIGRGTNYSFGIPVYIGYGIAMFLFVLSIIVVLRNVRKLDKNVAGALLPMLSASILVLIIQVIVPELLFTGGTITLITVGFFFSLENPVTVLRQKVLFDALTGVKSRHSYESDVAEMEKDFQSGTQFGMIFIDINGLKAVNDKMGHFVGDEYIGCVAQILMRCMENAESIYRMGGDEFLVVYRNKPREQIFTEMSAVEAACEQESQKKMHNVSVAMGFAMADSNEKSLRDVLRIADFKMYAEKAKRKRYNAFQLDKTDDINISGLTDRVFEALATTDTSRFIFVTNMTTEVTRWSVPAVEYLGLGSAFIRECNHVLLERIHPDDRKSFLEDTGEISTGRRAFSSSEYRIRNAGGEYVICICNGTFLRGKNNEPDLYAGTMQIDAALASIDRLTGLRNSRELTNHLRNLILAKTSATVLQFGIINLSRINMLYGFTGGNEILVQLAAILRTIVGNHGDVFSYDSNKFVLCLPTVDKTALEELYNEIRHTTEREINLDITTPPVKLAAGAVILTEEFNGTVSALHSNLIFAYDRSKYTEHGNLIFYDGTPDILLAGERKNLLFSVYRDAIGLCDGFHLVYQPIVRAEDGRIVGAEALIRWRDNVFGEVPPNDFIPWLEGDPCIVNLGNWILKQALTEVKPLLKLIPDFILNVNVAMQQLEHKEFGDAVFRILEEMDFPASQLCLELTERCRELNPDFLEKWVNFFRTKGIKIALDDFGTGFSSFSLLLNLRVDEIKLGQAFVRKIKFDKSNQILTKMLIDASNNLGYTTCLEGVESNDLCNYLKGYGATYYQGFYCSVPIAMEQLPKLIEQWNETAREPAAPTSGN